MVALTQTGKALLYWPPRALSILFVLFLSVFALDVFEESEGFWQTSLALGLHLIPALIVLAILVIAWRWEWVGAVLFTAAAVWYAVTAHRHPDWILTIAGPLLLVAALFLADDLIRRRLHARR